MGAVHGVSLKYVFVAVVSGAAARYMVLQELAREEQGLDVPIAEDMGAAEVVVFLACCYTCLINSLFALLFNLGFGMHVLGKDPKTGAVPLWSYVLFLAFHAPTWLYTKAQKLKDSYARVPVASEVESGWWVGGRYASELGKHWAGTLDMTCEFPEGCAATTDKYLLLPCWDGNPPQPDALESAALFGVQARSHGDVLVHCAHGRGRSTTVMCACLVKADLYPTWEDAFEAIRRGRKVVKLNRAMQAALTEWQDKYVATTPKRAAAQKLELDSPSDEEKLSGSRLARWAGTLTQRFLLLRRPPDVKAK